MDKIFLTVLNMSFTGAFVIAAICLARLPLKRAPKLISYCLWAVAGFRLVFPFTVESAFSLIPFRARPIPFDIAMQRVPHLESGLTFVDNSVSGLLPPANPIGSVNPLQIWTMLGAYVWLLVGGAMLIYGIVSYLLLKRGLRGARSLDERLYEADDLQTPFVLGFLRPSIYLPAGLTERERRCVLLHERTHLRRGDHIVKLAAYLILCLHWFNPLVWAAFSLMSADMEMACDERVLKEMGGETRADYSRSLLSLAVRRNGLGASPLAFSEGGIQARVKNVLQIKKPSRVVLGAAIALAVLLSLGFSVDRADEAPSSLREATGATVGQAELGGVADEYGTLIEDDRAIHVMGRKAVHMTLGQYDAWVAAGERDADVYDYAECVIYTPVEAGADRPMYMNIDAYKAWAAAGEPDADISDYAVPYQE